MKKEFKGPKAFTFGRSVPEPENPLGLRSQTFLIGSRSVLAIVRPCPPFGQSMDLPSSARAVAVFSLSVKIISRVASSADRCHKIPQDWSDSFLYWTQASADDKLLHVHGPK